MHNGQLSYKIMHFRSKIHRIVMQFRPYPLIKHYLGTTNPLCKHKNTFPNYCNVRFSVELFALAGLESQNQQYSAIFGMPLQPEGTLTFRESTIVRVFPLSSPLGLDGLSKSVKLQFSFIYLKSDEISIRCLWLSGLELLPFKSMFWLRSGSNPGRSIL